MCKALTATARQVSDAGHNCCTSSQNRNKPCLEVAHLPFCPAFATTEGALGGSETGARSRCNTPPIMCIRQLRYELAAARSWLKSFPVFVRIFLETAVCKRSHLYITCIKSCQIVRCGMSGVQWHLPCDGGSLCGRCIPDSSAWNAPASSIPCTSSMDHPRQFAHCGLAAERRSCAWKCCAGGLETNQLVRLQRRTHIRLVSLSIELTAS